MIFGLLTWAPRLGHPAFFGRTAQVWHITYHTSQRWQGGHVISSAKYLPNWGNTENGGHVAIPAKLGQPDSIAFQA